MKILYHITIQSLFITIYDIIFCTSLVATSNQLESFVTAIILSTLLVGSLLHDNSPPIGSWWLY